MARIMQRWPDHAQWSLHQIIDYTQCPGDDVVAWLSFGTQKQLSTDSRLTYSEGEAAVNALKVAHAAGAHISFTAAGPASVNIQSIYDQVRGRNRTHLQKKDWRRAYRNLVSFLNEYKTKIPLELFTEAHAECLRLAAKANAAPQEVYSWLDSAVTRLTEGESKAGLSEAMDFVDAYGESLAPSNLALIDLLVTKLRPLAQKHDLTSELDHIYANLQDQ